MVEHCDHNRSILLNAPAVEPFDQSNTDNTDSTTTDSLSAITKVLSCKLNNYSIVNSLPAYFCLILQLFLLRHAAAKRIEEEHDRLMEQREQSQKSDSQSQGESSIKSEFTITLIRVYILKTREGVYVMSM